MRKSLLFSLFVFICVATYGQQNLWQQMDESWLSADRFPNGSKPKAYKVFQLKSSIMTEELKRAPSEKSVSASNSSFILSVPNAEGVIERYRVVNAPVMHPDLAAKYPGIHSYAGKGIDRPNSTIRFSMGMGKFEGMILSTDRPTIYIDQSDEKNNCTWLFQEMKSLIIKMSLNVLLMRKHNAAFKRNARSTKCNRW
ncbi:MAG: hypothetical protein IPK31_03825 [Chitinophagaceae bacterium]|nr:hypothetical protein [Chitinophagaceae bacterium]